MKEIIDRLDRKIIYELDFDSRTPISKLAKKLRISKQVCQYRIDNLVRKNIIMGFYTDISASKCGLEIYILYFKFHHMPPEKYQQFIQYIAKQQNVGVNITVTGKWDHCIDIWASSIVQFKGIYRDVMREWEKYIISKDMMIETDFYYFKPKQILDKPSEQQMTMTGDIERPAKLDGTDRIILSALAKDSRVSLFQLAKITRLSVNAVKQRIKRMEKEGIILGYRIFLNYPLLGFLHYRIFLHFEEPSDQSEKKIIQFLKYHKTCTSITRTIGYCDLEFRAIVKDVGELIALMDEFKTRFPGLIKEYESILYYKMHGAWNYFPIGVH